MRAIRFKYNGYTRSIIRLKPGSIKKQANKIAYVQEVSIETYKANSGKVPRRKNMLY